MARVPALLQSSSSSEEGDGTDSGEVGTLMETGPPIPGRDQRTMTLLHHLRDLLCQKHRVDHQWRFLNPVSGGWVVPAGMALVRNTHPIVGKDNKERSVSTRLESKYMYKEVEIDFVYFLMFGPKVLKYFRYN